MNKLSFLINLKHRLVVGLTFLIKSTHHLIRLTNHLIMLTHHLVKLNHHLIKLTYHLVKLNHHLIKLNHHLVRLTHHLVRLTHQLLKRTSTFKREQKLSKLSPLINKLSPLINLEHQKLIELNIWIKLNHCQLEKQQRHPKLKSNATNQSIGGRCLCSTLTKKNGLTLVELNQLVQSPDQLVQSLDQLVQSLVFKSNQQSHLIHQPLVILTLALNFSSLIKALLRKTK